jgi:peptidoglycan hydrolase-like protein with peptidoglycan-binding domain
MGEGDSGAAVLALEQRLDALHYDVGDVDGTYDDITWYAVMAFQKVKGLERTGRATDDVVAAAATEPGSHVALAPQGGLNRVEVDLGRQVLFLYQGGALTRILPVSTGSEERFCSEGYCRYAVTPRGAYKVYRAGSGWETGPLGSLYNPLYFNGGIAFHGAYSVPGYPASHGCVRIPMNAAEWFPTVVGTGWPVFVSNGPGDEIAPPQAPAPPVPEVLVPPPTITLPSAFTP